MRTGDIQKLDPAMAAGDVVDDNLDWHDIRHLGVEGRGWDDTVEFYDRLPARAQGHVPDPVWELARRSAGMQVRFVTDAITIAARWTMRQPRWAQDSPRVANPHMPASAVSGLDLYAWHDGRWCFAGATKPEHPISNRAELVAAMLPGKRLFRLHLPLYNGVEQVEIGLPRGATLETAPAYDDSRPILCYGSSIVQGGCASRPGMTYPAILSRRLGRPTLNLGFSGNARAELYLAELFAEIDASVYLIDTLPNMQKTPELITERIEPFITTLRRARPTVPIVMIEDIKRQTAALRTDLSELAAAADRAFNTAWLRLEAAQVPGLYRIPAADLLGNDGDATVDGAHPTDLGFARMADAIEPTLRKALASPDA